MRISGGQGAARMDKVVEDQDSGDEDDPVVREIDVFLSQNMPGVRDPQVRRISSPAVAGWWGSTCDG